MNCGYDATIEDAQHRVYQVFTIRFKGRSFDDWNTEIPDQEAAAFIEFIGTDARINVERMIWRTWDE